MQTLFRFISAILFCLSMAAVQPAVALVLLVGSLVLAQVSGLNIIAEMTKEKE